MFAASLRSLRVGGPGGEIPAGSTAVGLFSSPPCNPIAVPACPIWEFGLCHPALADPMEKAGRGDARCPPPGHFRALWCPAKGWEPWHGHGNPTKQRGHSFTETPANHRHGAPSYGAGLGEGVPPALGWGGAEGPHHPADGPVAPQDVHEEPRFSPPGARWGGQHGELHHQDGGEEGGRLRVPAGGCPQRRAPTQ